MRRQENDTTLVCTTINLQMRALKNELADNVLQVEARHGGLEEILPFMSGKRSEEALEKGDVNGAALAVGQSIGLIKEIVSCKEVLTMMVQDAERILGQIQKRLGGRHK